MRATTNWPDGLFYLVSSLGQRWQSGYFKDRWLPVRIPAFATRCLRIAI